MAGLYDYVAKLQLNLTKHKGVPYIWKKNYKKIGFCGWNEEVTDLKMTCVRAWHLTLLTVTDCNVRKS